MRKFTKYAETDCTVEYLPHDRRQAFFDILRMQWRLLLLLGLFCLLFFAPMFLLSFFDLQTTYAYLQQAESGALSQSDAVLKIYAFTNTTSLLRIAAFLLLAVYFSAASRIFVKLTWQKGVLFRADVGIGLKQNVVGNLLIFFLFGALSFTAQYAHSLLMQLGGVYTAFSVALYALVYLVFLPVVLLYVHLSAVYTGGFGRHLRNAFTIYAGKLPHCLLAVLAAALPFCTFFSGNAAVIGVTEFLYALLYFPLWQLAWTLLCNKMSDEAINKKYHPELVDRGVWRPDRKDK